MPNHRRPDSFRRHAGCGDDFKIMFLQFLIQIIDFKCDMRNRSNQFRYRAIVLESHPFDAEGARAESGNVYLQVRQVSFSRQRFFCGDAQMMIFPIQFFNHEWRLIVFSFTIFHFRSRSSKILFELYSIFRRLQTWGSGLELQGLSFDFLCRFNAILMLE